MPRTDSKPRLHAPHALSSRRLVSTPHTPCLHAALSSRPTSLVFTPHASERSAVDSRETAGGVPRVQERARTERSRCYWRWRRPRHLRCSATSSSCRHARERGGERRVEGGGRGIGVLGEYRHLWDCERVTLGRAGRSERSAGQAPGRRLRPGRRRRRETRRASRRRVRPHRLACQSPDTRYEIGSPGRYRLSDAIRVGSAGGAQTTTRRPCSVLVLARGCRASAACWLAEPASGPRSRLAWLLGPRPCAIPIGNWNSQYRRSRAGARSRTVIGTGHVALAALARPRRSALFFAHGHANLLYPARARGRRAREISRPRPG